MFNTSRYEPYVQKHVLDSLVRYAQHHEDVGGFLTAVLENNLMEAFGRADFINREALYHICEFIYNEMPAGCHGSKEKVEAWLTHK